MLVSSSRCKSLWASLLVLAMSTTAFSPPLVHTSARLPTARNAESVSPLRESSSSSSSSTVVDTNELELTVRKLKQDLLQACRDKNKSSSSSSSTRITSLMQQLQDAAQANPSHYNNPALLSGDWDLVYSSDDPTRSSPFFWAFQAAFPDTHQTMFQVTDSIPEALKQVGPAQQSINYDVVAQTGQLVSRVQIQALQNMASSIMTTRASIVSHGNKEQYDAASTDNQQQQNHPIKLVLQVETTKPEQSTLLNSLLGPLGPLVNENLPAFPSGRALEQVRPGSSTVTMVTTFCDEGLRISFNQDRPSDQIFVWTRREFASYEYL